MKKLKQCDPRWANKKLGNSNLCSIGCTCTVCAMAAGTTPDKVVEACDFTANGSIYWASLSRVGLSFVWRGYKYSNSEVLKYIADCGFCLVEVLHPSGIKHWILAIGGGRIIDPLTGRECSLSKYKNLTGFCSLKKIKQEETMPDALQECLKQHGELVDELTKVKKSLKESKKLTKDTQGSLDTCNKSKEQMVSRSELNQVVAEKEALEEKLKELDKVPALVGKRKLVAGISAAVIILVSIILEKALGLEIAPQELIAMLAGPLAYIGAEGTADLIRIFKPSESQTIKK